MSVYFLSLAQSNELLEFIPLPCSSGDSARQCICIVLLRTYNNHLAITNQKPNQNHFNLKFTLLCLNSNWMYH